MTGIPNDGIICLPPGSGRRYAMGRLTAVFKADGAETGERYSASEWLLDPGQPGVGAQHAVHRGVVRRARATDLKMDLSKREARHNGLSTITH